MFGWSSLCHGAFWCLWLGQGIVSEIQTEDAAPQFLQMDLALAKPTANSPEAPRQMFLWHADAHIDPFYQTETRTGNAGWFPFLKAGCFDTIE